MTQFLIETPILYWQWHGRQAFYERRTFVEHLSDIFEATTKDDAACKATAAYPDAQTIALFSVGPTGKTKITYE